MAYYATTNPRMTQPAATRPWTKVDPCFPLINPFWTQELLQHSFKTPHWILSRLDSICRDSPFLTSRLQCLCIEAIAISLASLALPSRMTPFSARAYISHLGNLVISFANMRPIDANCVHSHLTG